jgi:hypothetical protein
MAYGEPIDGDRAWWTAAERLNTGRAKSAGRGLAQGMVCYALVSHC